MREDVVSTSRNGRLRARPARGSAVANDFARWHRVGAV